MLKRKFYFKDEELYGREERGPHTAIYTVNPEPCNLHNES
jgi:hypothetical protein